MYIDSLKRNSNDLMKEYNILHNNITSEIRKAQANYYKSQNRGKQW